MNDTQPNGGSRRSSLRRIRREASVAMRGLRWLWEKRSLVSRSVRAAGFALGWLYDKFPLPRRVKEITTELTFHAIEHFIVQSSSYQNWVHRGGGLTRLHQLFMREKESEPQPVHAPGMDAWEALAATYQVPTGRGRSVAIIVPVYKGYHETLACLFSVLSAQVTTPYSLTVIDDASPDATLREMLVRLSGLGLFTLHHHEKNQGFVRTVNEGMQLHPQQDVLLLNADTQVYDGWLDRMVAALYRVPATGSVTPFSNNAELCSYPRSFHGNHAPLEVDDATLNQLCAHANEGQSPELPTGVGFCMLLRREAIENVGLFDDDLFGRGYGEENDWCLRAAGQGWRHVLAADVFVRHHGAVSFEASKQRELRRSLRYLNERHPHYRDLVRRFRRADPLAPFRRQIDLARLKAASQRHAFLMISHQAGGGTEKHVMDMCERLAREEVSCYRLSPHPSHASRVCVWHYRVVDCPNLVFDMDTDQEALAACLRELHIAHVHMHHLLGFPQRMQALLTILCEALSVRYDVTLHDYYMACPSINLVYDQGMYVTDPDIATSQRWASRNPTAAGRTPIWLWRYQHTQLLKAARNVYAPSHDCADRMMRLLPGIVVQARPHPDEQITAPNLFKHHAPGTPLDVAIIGRLTRHKGAALVLAMARDAKRRNLPVYFHVFGEADDANALRKTGHVHVHGAYEEQAIYALLKEQRCHVALMASVWPETYSYTLSIAFNARLYPVCFDMGAPAERIRIAQWGSILSREAMLSPSLANDQLLALESTPAPTARVAPQVFHHYEKMLRDYYQLTLSHEAPSTKAAPTSLQGTAS